MTASLRKGTTQVDSDSQAVTVAPTISISGLVSSLVAGSSDTFTVRASGLDSGTTYNVRVTTNSGDIGFNSTCSDRQDDFTESSASTSYSTNVTLHGCQATGGTVMARPPLRPSP